MCGVSAFSLDEREVLYRTENPASRRRSESVWQGGVYPTPWTPVDEADPRAASRQRSNIRMPRGSRPRTRKVGRGAVPLLPPQAARGARRRAGDVPVGAGRRRRDGDPRSARGASQPLGAVGGASRRPGAAPSRWSSWAVTRYGWRRPGGCSPVDGGDGSRVRDAVAAGRCDALPAVESARLPDAGDHAGNRRWSSPPSGRLVHFVAEVSTRPRAGRIPPASDARSVSTMGLEVFF